MIPEPVELRLLRGDTSRVLLRATKLDPLTADMVAINLTGASVQFTAKRQVVDLDELALMRLTTENGGVVVARASEGIAVAVVPATAFASLPDDDLPVLFDAQVVEASGEVTTFMRGTIVVVPDVTRRMA